MSVPRFRIALLLAAVVAVAALVGVLLTDQRSPAGVHATAATTAPSPASPSPAGHPNGGRFFGRGGPGCGAIVPGAPPVAAVPFDGAYGFGFGCGSTGTVTAINGSTLTVRTLTGSLTVTTDSSTKYSKEGRGIALQDVKVNDVIRVRGQRQSGSSGQSSPTSIAARQITVVMPTFVGRVASVVGPTIFIVTADGQMAYVYTTPGTTYAISGAASSLGAVKPGMFVSAEGTQTDLTHLTADDVRVSSGLGGPGRHMPARPALPTPSGAAT